MSDCFARAIVCAAIICWLPAFALPAAIMFAAIWIETTCAVDLMLVGAICYAPIMIYAAIIFNPCYSRERDLGQFAWKSFRVQIMITFVAILAQMLGFVWAVALNLGLFGPPAIAIGLMTVCALFTCVALCARILRRTKKVAARIDT